MIDASLELGFLFERVHFDRKIGTSELAHSAPDTVVGPGGEHLTAPQLEHLFWAKGHTEVAAFAVVFPNDMKEFLFLFSHLFALICVSPPSI